MNPKSVNDLDPKLKETYERVMGTSLGANPTTSPVPTMETQTITQPQQTEPQPQPEAPVATIADENTTVSQIFRADSPSKISEPATVSSPSFKKGATTKTDGNKKSLLIIIAIGVVVFFAIYAVIWAKVLGLF